MSVKKVRNIKIYLNYLRNAKRKNYVLHSWTDNKAMEKRFLSERSPDAFVRRKISNELDIQDIRTEFPLLKLYPYEMETVNGSHIEILCTDEEQNKLSTNIRLLEDFFTDLINKSIRLLKPAYADTVVQLCNPYSKDRKRINIDVFRLFVNTNYFSFFNSECETKLTDLIVPF